MKYIGLFIIVGFAGLFLHVHQKEQAFEKGLRIGSEYTLEYGYLPSIWHREKMYEWASIVPCCHGQKKFWDSIESIQK
jgi:hypothetical protein